MCREDLQVRATIRAAVWCLSVVSWFLLALPCAGAASQVQISNQRRIGFNDGWRFYKGEAEGAEQPNFDDAKWMELRLPHDWAIEGPFDPSLNPHTGALPIFGTGWYRKAFTLPESVKDRYF